MGHSLIVVGFAAETENLLTNAQSKMARKRLDLIVANNVSARDAGFGVDMNRVIILKRGGEQIKLPLQSKESVAAQVILHAIDSLKNYNKVGHQ